MNKFFLPVLAFLFSSYLGRNMDNTWYEKSPLQPPNWLFPIVWTFLYISLFVSNYRVNDHRFMYLLTITFLLQAAWLYVFNQRNQQLASAILIACIVVAYLQVIVAFETDLVSGYLMIAYLAWIVYATLLNFTLKPKND
jgi:benzodiazapine receptor